MRHVILNIKENSFQEVRGLNHTGFPAPLSFSEKSYPTFKKFSSVQPQTCEYLTVRVVFIYVVYSKYFSKNLQDHFLSIMAINCSYKKEEISAIVRFSPGSTHQFPLKYRTSSAFLLILVGVVAFNTCQNHM